MDMVDLLRRFIKVETLGHWTLGASSSVSVWHADTSRHLATVSTWKVFIGIYKTCWKLKQIYPRYTNTSWVDFMWCDGLTRFRPFQPIFQQSSVLCTIFEDTRKPYERTRNNRDSTPHLGSLHSWLCIYQQYNARCHWDDIHHQWTTQGDQQCHNGQRFQWYPSTEIPMLSRNIVTGVTAHDSVNCDTAKHVGQTIMQSVTDLKVVEHTGCYNWNNRFSEDQRRSCQRGSSAPLPTFISCWR